MFHAQLGQRAREKERGARGVGEITSKVYMDSENAERLFAACEKLELPMIVHVAADFSERYGVADDFGLPRLESMLTRHPGAVYLGHARPFWSEISRMASPEERTKTSQEPVTEGRVALLMRRCPNLCCDLSARSGSNAMMRDPAYAARFLEEFQDRVFYGCDISGVSCKYPFAFSDFLEELRKNGSLSETAYRKIVRENALRLLNA